MNIILILAAVVPAVFLMVLIYKKDQFEHEPVSLIVSLVFLAILSCIIAIILETIGGGILGIFFSEEQLPYIVIENFIVVAISEEFSKYFMMKLRTWKSREFNCRFDGIVYSVIISLGFALWENIFYCLEYGLGVALLRAVTSIPGHACFGVFMGLFYGMARYYENFGYHSESKTSRKLAVIVPALFHGFYDFVLSLESTVATGIFVVFIIVMYIIAINRVKAMSSHDHYITGE